MDSVIARMPAFETADRFMRWAWGPWPYPRWQRRTYILLWPFLWPLRWIVLGIITIGCMLIFFAIAAVIEIASEVVEGIVSLSKHVRDQWSQ